MTGNVISEQRGRFVQIDDDNINIAIIVKVSKCATATAMARSKRGATLINELLELAIAKVVKKETRRLELILGKQFLYLWIYHACDDKNIRPTIIIEILEPGSPVYVSGLHP